MNLSIVASIDRREFEAGFFQETAKELNRAFNRMIEPVRARTRLEIDRLIRASQEYGELISGVLLGHMGLTDPVGTIDAVIGGIQQGVVVFVEPIRAVGLSLSGFLQVSVMKTDLSEVLGLAEASFTSERGHDVPWLRWLLTAGQEEILSTHFFLSANSIGKAVGRTGRGIMAPAGDSGLGWGVPGGFGGSLTDNWLTRALAGLPGVMEPVFQEEFQKVI